MKNQEIEVMERKREIRGEVWDKLEKLGIARFPLPPHHRIPNFEGAEEAAERLFTLEVLQQADVVKVNPDAPQQHVRYRLLRQGKKVLMPTPRLRQGFLFLDPDEIPASHWRTASTIRGAFVHGKLVTLNQLPRVDLVVVGSVAVARTGARLGKGEGYAELEFGVLRELSLVDERTPVATTVHDVQLVQDIPHEVFDVPVDIIATPTKLLPVNRAHQKPQGIYWKLLPDAKLKEIPVLQQLKSRRGAGL